MIFLLFVEGKKIVFKLSQRRKLFMLLKGYEQQEEEIQNGNILKGRILYMLHRKNFQFYHEKLDFA